MSLRLWLLFGRYSVRFPSLVEYFCTEPIFIENLRARFGVGCLRIVNIQKSVWFFYRSTLQAILTWRYKDAVETLKTF